MRTLSSYYSEDLQNTKADKAIEEDELLLTSEKLATEEEELILTSK